MHDFARWANEATRRMTLAEKVAVLSGADSWGVAPIDTAGVPGLRTSDGPSGVRGESYIDSRSAAFPCGASLAATWDPALVEEVGAALGREARAAGVQLLLAPMVNLQRHPLGGRDFESFSEDPYLTGEMAAAYIAGVQSEGVGCCVKHLVANESEFERHTISSEIDEEVLREIYLAPFERAVRAGVWAVMASYNRVNGRHSSESPYLLGDVLRGEWGFDGVVVSDWFATGSTREALIAGLDLEMPGPSLFRGERLVEAVRSGEVAEDAVDVAANRVLSLMARTVPASETVGQRPGPGPLIRRAGARGMVLLANDGLLPLSPAALGSVAVIGPGALAGQFQGGGSVEVRPDSTRPILESLRDALEPAEVVYERGCVLPDWPTPLAPPLLAAPDGRPGARLTVLRRADPTGEPVSEHLAPTFAGAWLAHVTDALDADDTLVRTRGVVASPWTGVHHVAIAATGRARLYVDGDLAFEAAGARPDGDEAFDPRSFAVSTPVAFAASVPRELVLEFEPAPSAGLTRFDVFLIPPNPPDLIGRAAEAARTADAAIVVVESPPSWETEGRDRPAFELPGAQDDLVRAVIAANPRTVVVVNAGSAHAMPWADDAAAVVQMWFPGQELGASLADVLTGAVNPSGKLPASIPRALADVPADAFYPGENGVARYGERFEVGYRRFPDSAYPQPRFAFGHGLSYSTFVLGDPEARVVEGGAGWQIAVPVTNAAGPRGREVVQAYFDPGRSDRPERQLVGFAGVEVGPGETEIALIDIPPEALRTWQAGAWHAPDSPPTIRLGASSVSLPLTVALPAGSAGDGAAGTSSGVGRTG